MEVLTLIIVGAVAGWLGSMIYKGSSLGFLGNLIVGIIGGFVGGIHPTNSILSIV